MGNNFKKERAFCESFSSRSKHDGVFVFFCRFPEKKWHVKNVAKIIERLQKDNRIEHMKKGFV